MKKGFTVILALILLLSGCSRPLDKEDVLQKMSDNQSKINSYHLILGMSVDVKASNGQKDYSEVEFSADVQAKKEAYHLLVTKENIEKEVVIKDKEAYLKDEYDDWEELSKKEGKELIVQIKYETFTKIIHSISKDLSMKTEADDYLLSYEGNSKKLYKLLQKYYKVTFDGLDFEEDGVINLDAKIDKKTLQLKELNIVITAVNDNGKVTIEIKMELDQFGAIKEIQLPNIDE